MSKNIVFEGWLTKSPPAKRIWRAKWRRRWFSLRQSSELPGQYYLDYYADRNCRRQKGTIDLDLCEQVDAGLHMERGNCASDSKVRGSGFTIRTQSRTYCLEADCEADMEKWVDIICRVCGLRASDDAPDGQGTYHQKGSLTTLEEAGVGADHTGPYIPISECITGIRTQEKQRAFTFDPKNIVTSSRRLDPGSARSRQMYLSQPQIRLNPESENDSNLSEEDCKSLNAQHCNIGEFSVAKSFTKLAVSSKRNGHTEGPPVPPRPPKTLTMPRDYYHKEAFQGPKIQEPMEANNDSIVNEELSTWLRTSRHMSQCSSPASPGRMPLSLHRYTDDEDDHLPICPSLTYFNLPMLPPAVDRALKPRHSNCNCIGHILNNNQHFCIFSDEVVKPDALQYLDLDLAAAKPLPVEPHEAVHRKRLNTNHAKSLSSAEANSAYKTVDFIKTEAFNITMQDAEALRSTQV